MSEVTGQEWEAELTGQELTDHQVTGQERQADRPAVHTGRRKSARARVKLTRGSGQITVNNRPADEYFPTVSLRAVIDEPFRVSDTEGQFDVTVRVLGGGLSGQAGAVCHGIARALERHDPNLRRPLKQAGLLTRDAREVERKKYGLKKARKAPQFTKR